MFDDNTTTSSHGSSCANNGEGALDTHCSPSPFLTLYPAPRFLPLLVQMLRCSDAQMSVSAFDHLLSDSDACRWAVAQVGQTVKRGTYTILKVLGQGAHAVRLCFTFDVYMFYGLWSRSTNELDS
eukprot:360662-Prorocentrum_minimum.AAC.1